VWIEPRLPAAQLDHWLGPETELGWLSLTQLMRAGLDSAPKKGMGRVWALGPVGPKCVC